jgi:hypothetical protein
MSDAPTKLEDRLTAMFEAQSQAMAIPERDWTDLDEPWLVPVLRNPRRRYGVGLVALAAATLAIGIPLTLSQGHGARRVPAADGSASFRAVTPQVSMAASELSIEVGGRSFSGATTMDVHSDPGTWQKYTTLELTWTEHDVEMRLFMYFTSDGHEWWSNELRTYNGRSPGDWVTYRGDFFRRPLGTPFTGNLDVTGTEGGIAGHLRLSDLRLEAFRRPTVCEKPVSRYALDPAYPSVAMQQHVGGGFGVAVTVMDTAACEPVDAGRFDFAWTIADPAVASVRPDGARADLSSVAAGSTRLHVEAADRNTGAAVASSDIPVTVR